MVRETSNDAKIVINQPAGHWENHETLEQAVIRETLEETAHEFIPQGLVGCYQWKLPQSDKTYLRFCFHGEAGNPHTEMTLDDGIISAEWFSLEELIEQKESLRSPMVLLCIQDYLAGKRYPIDVVTWVA